ncbi:MAG: hypothetical protein NTZ86_08960 [Legionellales bacterium]|nr:hypothetical protein [Legionellales bacterium]
MNYKARKEQFLERFGITDKTHLNELVVQFKNGIANCLDHIDTMIPSQEIRRYCGWFGVKASFNLTMSGEYGKNIYNCVTKEDDWGRYLLKIEQIFYLNFTSSREKNELFKNVSEIFQNSELSLNFILSKDSYVVYPNGSDFLDKEIVNKTLKFLNNEAHEHFICALRLFSKQNKADYIKCSESIRRSFEEFLKFTLQNQKGLKENIKIIEPRLKNDHKINEIRSIFHSYLDVMDKFFNENSKHKDGDIGAADCEFIIFLAALLMRYLSQIKQEH